MLKGFNFLNSTNQSRTWTWLWTSWPQCENSSNSLKKIHNKSYYIRHCLRKLIFGDIDIKSINDQIILFFVYSVFGNKRYCLSLQMFVRLGDNREDPDLSA